MGVIMCRIIHQTSALYVWTTLPELHHTISAISVTIPITHPPLAPHPHLLSREVGIVHREMLSGHGPILAEPGPWRGAVDGAGGQTGDGPTAAHSGQRPAHRGAGGVARGRPAAPETSQRPVREPLHAFKSAWG